MSQAVVAATSDGVAGARGHRRLQHRVNIAYALTPGTFAEFIDLVVPELARRGRVWEDHESDTLREHIYDRGQRRLRDDHPGAEHRFGTARAR